MTDPINCTISFNLDISVLTDEKLLEATAKELNNAFFAWRRKAQCQYLGHTTTDHNGRCLRCLEDITSHE